jgi:hypothetical protein
MLLLMRDTSTLRLATQLSANGATTFKARGEHRGFAKVRNPWFANNHDGAL